MPNKDFELQPFEWNDVLDYNPSQGMYARFHTHVRAQNPSIKTLIAIGGWTFNAKPETNWIFSTLSSSVSSRATFIQSSINFARTHGFDGIDIDWEYPNYASQGGQPEDYANFPLLIQEFREAITLEADKSGREPLLLTIAVPAYNPTISNGYDVPAIHPFVDWIGVMSYDLYGSWGSITGLHTQLYAPDTPISVSGGMQAWLEAGAPANKLVMGVGTYGRGWTLQDTTQTGIGAPASGGSTPGPGTSEVGYLSVTEIMAMQAAGGTVYHDNERASSYLVLNDQWVGFDTIDDIKQKLRWASSQGFAGVMNWAIDLDDFNNGYPYMSAISETLSDLGGVRKARYLRGRRIR